VIVNLHVVRISRRYPDEGAERSHYGITCFLHPLYGKLHLSVVDCDMQAGRLGYIWDNTCVLWIPGRNSGLGPPVGATCPLFPRIC
jgi:hypothetical protein